ncbi:MAG: RNA polymerase factor sigma-54 [Gammaproteobacteria bacterium]|nr:RNA polymerase factor sigma-54 [Gammaproteobacteria bacterium]MDE2263518.1 RNA polymerase factor sigma-54 [Gammaproteobacteria bacterium]
MKPSLQLKLGQQLTMTPQLQQAIRLLQLPALELQAHIRELLESNVMLEPMEEGHEESLDSGTLEHAQAPEAIEAAEAPRESAVEVLDEGWGEHSVGPAETPWSGDDDDRQQEFADSAGQSLQEYLLWQLELAKLEPRRLAIARAIVDAISDDGYLTEPLEEIASTLRPEIHCEAAEVEAALADVQALDPPGVGARSVGECIELQLRQLDPTTPGFNAAIEIARHHLERIAGRELAVVKRELRASDEELACALALVRSCHPRPGATVSAGSAEYVVPDVFVRRTEHGWAVEINSATLPRVRLNQSYASLIGRNASHATMRAQLQEARWLLKSLEIRHETLIKVARSIVERQTAFLEHGEEHMRPMILKDIAEAIGMHESTISRVTSGKYMHTPRGVFELRYFFSSHVEGADGSGTSSTAIRAKIRKLVKDEVAESPLSDGRIAELLSAEGIPVARRTVAKYREAMGIPPSNERRRAGTGQM